MKSAIKESPVIVLDRGVFLDPVRADVPSGGGVLVDQLHLINGSLKSLPGWSLINTVDVDQNAVLLDGPAIFGKDVIRLDGTHYFLIGTPTSLYQLSNDTLTVLKTGFNTSVNDRWQSAYINGDLILVNNNEAPQIVTAGPTVADLSGDGEMPDSARFVANLTGHLVFLNTVEGSVRRPQRLRWSQIHDPTVYIATDNNEARFFDLDETPDEITGAALLGTRELVIYKQFNIYKAIYEGRPTIFAFDRIVTDEGLFAPYSLVAWRDNHFFLGNNDFYRFDGSQVYPIGVNRVRDAVFKMMQKAHPDQFYGFAHPEFPEIWWVFKQIGFDAFNTCFVYNYESDVWTTRAAFPHSMLCEVFDIQTVTFDQVTNNFDESILTFDEKKQGGSFTVFSGDESGRLYEHGRAFDAAGSPLIWSLETGDLIKGSRPAFVNRINLALNKVGTPLVIVYPMFRNQYIDPMQPWTSIPFDGTPQIDFRLLAKYFGVKIQGSSPVSIEGFTYEAKGAGQRV